MALPDGNYTFKQSEVKSVYKFLNKLLKII
jgi:hypothetical protein